MNYPTIEQVNGANQIQLCTWYRFLPSTSNDSEMEIMKLIVKKCLDGGGFTPEISKQIGW